MRYFKNLVWFGIGFFLSAVACFSYAETIPATPAYGEWGSDANAHNTELANAYVTWAQYRPISCELISGCMSKCFTYKWPGATGQKIELGNSGIYNCPAPTYSCPSGQNWSLSGSNCTRPDCADGEIRQSDGSCRNACASLAGTANSVFTGSSVCGQGGIPGSQCLSGCEIAIGGLGIEMGGSWCAQVGRYTGRSCAEAGDISPVPAESPTSDGKIDPEGERLPKDSPEKKCVDQGQGFGSVNGVVICVDPTTTTGKKTDTTKTTDSTGQTTTSTTTTDTKTVKNPDGSTTTITTVTNPDGTKTETTTTTSGSANGGGGNGNGDGDFGWGEPGEEGALTEKEAGASSLTPVEIAGGASCPPPVSLPHGWGEVRYDLACSLADKVRPIVLAFAWLAAGLIVIGGVKGD
jgi:hypothetical protein